jgi:hypothetical protein
MQFFLEKRKDHSMRSLTQRPKPEKKSTQVIKLQTYIFHEYNPKITFKNQKNNGVLY